MAIEIDNFTFTLPAAADLTTKQFFIVKVDSNGKAALASTGQYAIGVVQNKPNTDEAASIRNSGVTKIVAGGAITAGDLVKSDSNGKAAVAVLGTAAAGGHPVNGSSVIGVALDTVANANELVTVLLTHSGVAPTTAA